MNIILLDKFFLIEIHHYKNFEMKLTQYVHNSLTSDY